MPGPGVTIQAGEQRYKIPMGVNLEPGRIPSQRDRVHTPPACYWRTV
jgi:hypothetical protein